MAYLTRRGFEYCATHGIDSGVSTLAGRFGVFSTSIYASKESLDGYLNEYIFWGMIGPLNTDDDKFHTRWLIEHDWKIRLQAGPESTAMTELGEWPKFKEQILRWMRTTWRSNPRQLLFHSQSWLHHPYTTLTLLLWFFDCHCFKRQQCSGCSTRRWRRSTVRTDTSWRPLFFRSGSSPSSTSKSPRTSENTQMTSRNFRHICCLDIEARSSKFGRV
jgi:hypothetical protein